MRKQFRADFGRKYHSRGARDVGATNHLVHMPAEARVSSTLHMNHSQVLLQKIRMEAWDFDSWWMLSHGPNDVRI
jgi:hypothetical protein